MSDMTLYDRDGRVVTQGALNQLMGQIDNYKACIERRKALEAALRNLLDAAKSREYDERHGSSNHCSDCGYEVHTPDDCDYAAAIAEAERLLGDAT